jgi:hypothetical protein
MVALGLAADHVDEEVRLTTPGKIEPISSEGPGLAWAEEALAGLSEATLSLEFSVPALAVPLRRPTATRGLPWLRFLASQPWYFIAAVAETRLELLWHKYEVRLDA